MGHLFVEQNNTSGILIQLNLNPKPANKWARDSMISKEALKQSLLGKVEIVLPCIYSILVE